MSYQREFPRRLRVGLVGVGSHAYRNLLPALNFLPVELLALGDPKEDLRRATGAQYGVRHLFPSLESMLDGVELDAVFLAVSPFHHPTLAQTALARGVHVWMEKPAAVRAHELDEVIAARGPRVAVVGLKKAFMPALVKAREILGLPRSGKLLTLAGSYPVEVPPDGASILRQRTFTNWLGNGCHPLSALLALGGPLEAVATHRSGPGGGVCLLRFRSGVLGNLHLATGARDGQDTYQAYADGSQVTIDNDRVLWHRGVPLPYGTATSFAPEGTDHGTVVWEPKSMLATLENQALFVQGLWGSMNHFCQAILAGRPATEGTLEFAREVMQAYEAALLSRGEFVPIG